MGGTITTDAARNTLLFLLLLLLFGMLIHATNMAAAVPTTASSPSPDVSICVREGCNCTKTPPHWLIATCSFESNQMVELGAGSLPPEILELNVTRSRGELRLLSGAFSQVWALQRVRLSEVERLVVRRHAFLNLSAPHTLLEVLDCGSAVIETHSFKAVRGPLTAVISRCAHVIVQNSAFSWILAISVKDVPRLELFKQAFSFEAPTTIGRHGPAATVLLQNVMLSELPQSAFPSSAAEVRLVDVEIRTVRRDAFCANTLFSVIFQNTSLHRVETGAFSDRTLIQYLEMSSVRIRVLASNAVQAGINNLTIQHSRVSEVMEGAMNITVAKATLINNVFEKILPRGFFLKYWNCITIDNNTFQWLEADAMNMPFEMLPGVNKYELSFIGNEVDKFSPGALGFAAQAIRSGAGIKVNLLDNRFTQVCHCNLISWVQDMLTAEKGAIDGIFNTSFCMVDSLLARCFNVPQGFVNMRNYTELVCGSAEEIVCEELSKGESAVSVVRNSNSFGDDADQEKKVLGLIFIVVVCATAVILVITGVLWLRQKGYCVQARIMLFPTTTSCLTMFSALFQGTGGLITARSISRLSIHEYAEQQQQQKQRQGLLVVNEDNVSEGEGEQVPCEDKWTQTLPEELTQELLQSLRDKLDDPENYSDARDMIEHLYDLIKVEESCNNNNMPSTSRNFEEYEDDDELYDVIQVPPLPVRYCQNKAKKPMCDVGTRAPSPDKLLPYSQVRRNRQPAVVCEYVEPRDREQHLYTELPAGEPPANSSPNLASPTTSSGSGANKSPTRPLSFLRALGESILPKGSTSGSTKLQQPPTSVLCEYAEPTDAEIHVYTEVPPATTIKCSNKMANRPLPTKPDQEQDPGEGTSAS